MNHKSNNRIYSNSSSGMSLSVRYRIQKLAVIFLILLMAGFSCIARGQSGNEKQEIQVKAAYLYNFTKFVYWKSLQTDNNHSILTIGLLHADPIADLLDEYIKTTSQQPRIVIERISLPDTSLTSCQLVYIDESQKANLPDILKRLKGANVLTVSDINGFARKGGMVGFINEDERIRIEINLSEVTKSGLEVSAKLIEVARIVK
jgi:hypothetical protein